jgi:hypothetical protein
MIIETASRWKRPMIPLTWERERRTAPSLLAVLILMASCREVPSATCDFYDALSYVDDGRRAVLRLFQDSVDDQWQIADGEVLSFEELSRVTPGDIVFRSGAMEESGTVAFVLSFDYQSGSGPWRFLVTYDKECNPRIGWYRLSPVDQSPSD